MFEPDCDHCGQPVAPEDLVQPGLGVGVGEDLHEQCLLVKIDKAFERARARDGQT